MKGSMKEDPQSKQGGDSVVFEPQRFQPMIKVNNRFIAEDGRNYERPPEHREDGPVLCRQTELSTSNKYE